jgi:hypothetical protein
VPWFSSVSLTDPCLWRPPAPKWGSLPAEWQ